MIKHIRQTMHTTIPVYRGNRDTIVGILFARDLLNVDHTQGVETNWKIEDYVRSLISSQRVKLP